MSAARGWSSGELEVLPLFLKKPWDPQQRVTLVS